MKNDNFLVTILVPISAIALLVGCSPTATVSEDENDAVQKVAVEQPAQTTRVDTDPTDAPAPQSSAGKQPATTPADTRIENQAPQAPTIKRVVKRGALLAKPEGPDGNPYEKMYSRQRLAKAALIRHYAPIKVIPIELSCVCRTAWTNGQLHLRIALLGPQHNLMVFTRENSRLYVAFTDEAMGEIHKVIVPINQMKKDRQAINPTVAFEARTPLSLEKYEQFYQWTCDWE